MSWVDPWTLLTWLTEVNLGSLHCGYCIQRYYKNSLLNWPICHIMAVRERERERERERVHMR